MTTEECKFVFIDDDASKNGTKIRVYNNSIARIRISDSKIMAICALVPNVNYQYIRKISKDNISLTNEIVCSITNKVNNVEHGLELLNNLEKSHPLYAGFYEWIKYEENINSLTLQ